MGMRQTAVRRPSPVRRVVAWWLLVPALLLGVIAMHAMVSAPGQHDGHAGSATASAAMTHTPDPVTTSSDRAMTTAPEPAGGAADLGCGATLLMCLAVLLVVVLTLLAGPARRWIGRGPTYSSAQLVARRPPFMVMPVLLTTSILRC